MHLVKRQRIVHSYGEEELVDTDELQAELEEHISEGSVPRHMPTTIPPRPENIDVVISGQKCKCGSTTHQRTLQRECPLKSVKRQRILNGGEELVDTN